MAARRLGLCLVGFGTVGQALVRLIETERERLLEIEALDLQVSAVATRRFVHVHDSGGLDVDSLLRRAERRERHGPAVEAEIAAATLPGDIVVETMPLEPHTGGAAIAVTPTGTNIPRAPPRRRRTAEPCAAHQRPSAVPASVSMTESQAVSTLPAVRIRAPISRNTCAGLVNASTR